MHSLIALLIFLAPLFVQAKAAPSAKPSWTYIEKRLVKEKFSPSFIKAMKKSYEVERFEEVLRLNVLLFLKKSDYHGVQISPQATQDVKNFNEKHRVALETASRTYGVPANVISSLIWIESRHGKTLGTFHVPSAYLHLLQAPRKSVVNYLYSQTYRFTDKVTRKQRRDIPIRAERKAKFAIQELKALAKVHKWNWKMGPKFRGSFSGAFGLPQFIPSSYVAYARAMTPKAQPDLMTADDAIMSVAHYLKVHGWKSEKERSHVEALMKYNNSRDYANAILNLAETVKPETIEQRTTASSKD